MSTEKPKTNLSKVGEPDRFEIAPGLVLEDKLRIKTQRRLEKHFNLPVARIFPGQSKNPVTGKIEKWDGVDFNFLNNAIPLITILAQQVDDSITEQDMEQLFDSTEDETVLFKNLESFFKRLRPKGTSKNSQRPSQKQKNPTGH